LTSHRDGFDAFEESPRTRFDERIPPGGWINLCAVRVGSASLANPGAGIGVANHHLDRLGRGIDTGDEG
jgi:hypothetical protein